jgi:hypothetical protein
MIQRLIDGTVTLAYKLQAILASSKVMTITKQSSKTTCQANFVLLFCCVIIVTNTRTLHM